jgi:effector-binding domain-containing protein
MTLSTPCVVATEPQPVAMVRLCVSWAEMPHVVVPGLAELRAAVATQGIGSDGAWFTYRFRMPTDTADFAICVPVARMLLPAATVVRATMRGDYSGLAAAWGELRDLVAANRHTTGTAFWECYTVGPETSADPADWRTELNRPLLTAG